MFQRYSLLHLGFPQHYNISILLKFLLLEKWQSFTFQEFLGYLLESFPCKIAVMTQYFH